MTLDEMKEIYPNGLDAYLCLGYYDGSKRSMQLNHPAYIHGYLNRVDDMYGRPRKSASEIREDLNYIESVFLEDIS